MNFLVRIQSISGAILLTTLLLLAACQPSAPSTPPSPAAEEEIDPIVPLDGCWDVELSSSNANQAISQWATTWPANTGVPQKFDIQSLYIDSVLQSSSSSLGFRAYYGLTDTSTLSSMVLLIVPLDATGDDYLDSDGEAPVTLLDNQGTSSLDISQASSYTQNWRTYYGVDKSDAAVICETAPPGRCGTLRTGQNLLAPLAQTFSKKSLYAFLYEAGYSTNSGGNLSFNFALPEIDTSLFEMDIYIQTSTLSSMLDFSRPCPQYCGQSNTLNSER